MAYNQDTEPAVQAALSKLGSDYVWGATGPNTFDCSGLTQWSMKQAGIDIPRTTYAQVNVGDPVSGPPQRGDLVFPEAGHVGIALGGNQMVHAPETGDVVKISNYWTTPYAVRRMGPNSGTPGSVNTDPSFAAGSSFNAQGVSGGMFQNGALASLKQTATYMGALTEADNWIRAGQVIGGGVLVLMGLGFAVGGGMLGESTKSTVHALPGAFKSMVVK